MDDLVVNWITRKDAEFAVKRWHYSRKMPGAGLVCVGFWEGKNFIGTVIFGMGANFNIALSFGLKQLEACELVRVALRTTKKTTTSHIVMRAIEFLKKQSPNLKLIVSYADIDQNHHGGIYQATNWFYLGVSKKNMCVAYIFNGRKIHRRSANKEITKVAIPVISKGRHKYIFPLDKRVRKKCLKAELPPYPKKDDHDRPKIVMLDFS